MLTPSESIKNFLADNEKYQIIPKNTLCSILGIAEEELTALAKGNCTSALSLDNAFKKLPGLYSSTNHNFWEDKKQDLLVIQKNISLAKELVQFIQTSQKDQPPHESLGNAS